MLLQKSNKQFPVSNKRFITVTKQRNKNLSTLADPNQGLDYISTFKQINSNKQKCLSDHFVKELIQKSLQDYKAKRLLFIQNKQEDKQIIKIQSKGGDVAKRTLFMTNLYNQKREKNNTKFKSKFKTQSSQSTNNKTQGEFCTEPKAQCQRSHSQSQSSLKLASSGKTEPIYQCYEKQNGDSKSIIKELPQYFLRPNPINDEGPVDRAKDVKTNKFQCGFKTNNCLGDENERNKNLKYYDNPQNKSQSVFFSKRKRFFQVRQYFNQSIGFMRSKTETIVPSKVVINQMAEQTNLKLKNDIRSEDDEKFKLRSCSTKQFFRKSIIKMQNDDDEHRDHPNRMLSNLVCLCENGKCRERRSQLIMKESVLAKQSSKFYMTSWSNPKKSKPAHLLKIKTAQKAQNPQYRARTENVSNCEVILNHKQKQKTEDQKQISMFEIIKPNPTINLC